MAHLRAIVINIIPPDLTREEGEKECAELVRLLHTLQGIVVVHILQKRGRPSASTFLGSGKAEEVAQLAKQLHADVVVANAMLKTTQINNLNKIIPCPVWDRVDVILKIFERHATTQEAKWQVELARLKHEFPRLYGQGVGLAQIASGKKGYARGPGEKLLEQKKRHLRSRMESLEKKVKQLQIVHRTQREVRQHNALPHLALVGYTNSGKSSLLVALTRKKNVVVADKLFATLDTRIGSLYLQDKQQKVLLSDTIGFIQNLPPYLISSFLTTLQEARKADLLLHVVDASESIVHIQRNIRVVQEILESLQAAEKPTIYIFNKADLLSIEQRTTLQKEFCALCPIFVSAQKKYELEKLKIAISEIL